jgi:hypothetical protein
MSDPVVALLVLDAAQRQLVPRVPTSGVWANMMTVSELTGPGWLLAYEAAAKGWLPNPLLGQHPDFAAMRNANVEFYQVLAAPQHIAISLPLGGGGGGASP